jgi:hypothetical protein
MNIPEITLLPNAARRVAEIAVKLNKDPVLRLSVDGGGAIGGRSDQPRSGARVRGGFCRITRR